VERGAAARIAVTLERDPNSPLWGERGRPKLTFDLEGGPIAGLSLGGNVGGCDKPCDRSIPFGAIGLFRAGYELASGLGFTVDAGYAGLSQKAKDRPATLTEIPDGLRQSTGTASDELAMHALMFGASAAYHGRTEGAFVWSVRLGGGILVGTMTDVRTGRFVYNAPPPPPPAPAPPPATPYDVGPYREVASMTSAYVMPEVRAGFRFANHFELSAGLLGSLLIGISVPKWEDKNEVVTPPTGGMGLGRFGEESMSGKVIFLAAPTLGLRYDFAL
jgi:hypothetical protein